MLIVAFFYHFEFSEVFYLVYCEMFDVSFSKTLVTVIYCLPNQVIQKMENVLEKKVKAAPETSGKIKAFPYPYRDERGRCKNCGKGSSKVEKSNLPKTKNTASLVESVCVETIQFIHVQ